MPDLFGEDIAGELAEALGQGLLPVRLTQRASGSRDASNPTRLVDPVPVTYNARGFLERRTRRDQSGNRVESSGRVAGILGGSLPSGVTPGPGDAVEVEGLVFHVAEDGVERDPAGALWLCWLEG